MAGQNLLQDLHTKCFIAVSHIDSTTPRSIYERHRLNLNEVGKALDIDSKYPHLHPNLFSSSEVIVLTHHVVKQGSRKRLANGLGIPISHIIDLGHAPNLSTAFGDHLRENITVNVDEVRVNPRLEEWLIYGNPLLPLCKACQDDMRNSAQPPEVKALKRENPDISAHHKIQQTTAHIPYDLPMMQIPEQLNMGLNMNPEPKRPSAPLQMRKTGALGQISRGGNTIPMLPDSPIPMKSMIHHHHNNTVNKFHDVTKESLPTPPTSGDNEKYDDNQIVWNSPLAYGPVSRTKDQDTSSINVPAIPDGYYNGLDRLSGDSGQQQQELDAQMAEHFDKIPWPPLPVGRTGMTTSMNASAFPSSDFGASSQTMNYNRQSNFASPFEESFHSYEYPEPIPQSVGPYVTMHELEIEKSGASPYPPHFDLHAMPLPAPRNGPEDYNFEPMDPSHPDHRSQRRKKAAQTEALEAIKRERKDNKQRVRLENYRQQLRPEPIAIIDVSNPQMPSQTETATANPETPVKRPRGRPRKHPLPLPLRSSSTPEASTSGKRRGPL